jgi:hypothetical protein
VLKKGIKKIVYTLSGMSKDLREEEYGLGVDLDQAA